MFGTLDIRLDDLPITGHARVTYVDLVIGPLALHLTEKQLRELVECGIDLLSDLNLGRLPGCEGSDLPEADKAA